MTAYYKTSPSPDCLQVLRQGFTPGLSQDGDGVDVSFMEAIPKLVEAGHVCLFHDGPVVFMLRRKSAWVGSVDVFIGDDAGIHDAIRAGRAAIAWAAENTYYHKLEARSPWPMMRTLALRTGWTVEGYRFESYRNADGTMLDEIEVGIILRGTPCHKSH